MSDSLQTLRDLAVPIGSVLDVGVHHGSPPFKNVFPDVEHWLFEPVAAFHDAITRYYADVPYRLFHVALSGEEGQANQVLLSVDRGGVVTHSQLSNDLARWEGNPHVVQIEPVQQTRLDTILKESAPAAPYLLKIDVDGVELDVLRGATDTLSRCSVVIVEASASGLLERLQFIANAGFGLFDVVDSCYYGGVLWQVDLVLVAREILAGTPRMRPMEGSSTFESTKWWSVTERFFQ
jgi:FkbM family methyltransferase